MSQSNLTMTLPNLGGNRSLGAAVASFLAFLGVALMLLLAPQPAAAQGEGNYQLGTGDRVRVTVFGHEDLSGEFEVSASGIIAMPLIGEVQASGRSLNEVEQEIVAKLSPDYLRNPRVGVEVMNYRPFYIIGEVQQPGSYPYVNGMRILNAVALAGGFTYRAREDEFYIQRASDPSGKKVNADPGTQVLPGDVITVRERFF